MMKNGGNKQNRREKGSAGNSFSVKNGMTMMMKMTVYECSFPFGQLWIVEQENEGMRLLSQRECQQALEENGIKKEICLLL